MYIIPEKKYSKFPRVIDVIDDKPIIAYFRCPKCNKNRSIGIHEIYSDGTVKKYVECSCGFIGTIKLENWANRHGDLI